MVKGIGIDVVEIGRVGEMLDRWGSRFLEKIFTEREISYVESKVNPAQHLAARFAAKEAFAKAAATGMNGGFRWKDIEVSNVESGKPTIVLYGNSRKLFGECRIFVSITHSALVASAVVIIEKL